MNNEQVKSMLRGAGIPKEAFVTTLLKEGMMQLRGYITERREDDKRILYIYPSHHNPSAAIPHQARERAELAFYLTAKELSLSGEDVFCCDLVDIHTALFKETDEAIDIDRRINGRESGFICIRHFHDTGGRVAPFLTPYESAYFASWMIRRYQDGVGFLLLGGSPIMEAEDWWPASFVGYLRGRSVSFDVKAHA